MIEARFGDGTAAGAADAEALRDALWIDLIDPERGEEAMVEAATLGLINIRQNGTIRVLSVVAVVFLPPTLIASLYGMNFRHMPELAWPMGYPLAGAISHPQALAAAWLFVLSTNIGDRAMLFASRCHWTRPLGLQRPAPSPRRLDSPTDSARARLIPSLCCSRRRTCPPTVA